MRIVYGCSRYCSCFNELNEHLTSVTSEISKFGGVGQLGCHAIDIDVFLALCMLLIFSYLNVGLLAFYSSVSCFYFGIFTLPQACCFSLMSRVPLSFLE